MIDADGYIKIVDLGFAKIVLDKSYTFCGTPDYLAPEIITAKGHNHTVDYWSYGVLLYELLTGRSPFSRPGLPHIKLFQRIVLLKYSFPLFMDPAGQDLIQRLLVRNATKRLGSQKNGYVDVRNHPFFHDAGIDDPKRLLKREITPPWIPVNDSKNNNRNNHGMMMMMDATDCNDFKKIERDDFSLSGPPLTAKEQELFNDF
jgi:serine/threonine protein kinase